MKDSVRSVYLEAARSIPAVIDVAATQWEESSALADWTIGGLTGHLARAVATVVRYLDQPVPPRGPEMDAVDYFTSFDLRAESFASSVVARGEAEAAEGPEALKANVETWIERLDRELPGLSHDHRVAVLDAFALTLDEYLRTRLVEMVVHHADLGTTLDLDDLPAAARSEALSVLLELSRRKHGDRAVIEALSRSERAEDISFF